MKKKKKELRKFMTSRDCFLAQLVYFNTYPKVFQHFSVISYNANKKYAELHRKNSPGGEHGAQLTLICIHLRCPHWTARIFTRMHCIVHSTVRTSH